MEMETKLCNSVFEKLDNDSIDKELIQKFIDIMSIDLEYMYRDRESMIEGISYHFKKNHPHLFRDKNIDDILNG